MLPAALGNNPRVIRRRISVESNNFRIQLSRLRAAVHEAHSRKSSWRHANPDFAASRRRENKVPPQVTVRCNGRKFRAHLAGKRDHRPPPLSMYFLGQPPTPLERWG